MAEKLELGSLLGINNPMKKLEFDGYRELFITNIELQAKLVAEGLNIDAHKLDKDDPGDFYAIHNGLWEILLFYECRPQTANLQRNTHKLYEACIRHNMAPLFWITKNEEDPRKWLSAWPEEWNGVDYVWQRNLCSRSRRRIQRRSTRDSTTWCSAGSLT